MHSQLSAPAASRSPASSTCVSRCTFCQRQSPLRRQLEQHRLRCRGIEASTAFADCSQSRYYETTAGNKKGKVVKRIKEQRNRLRQLAERLPEEPAATLHTVVQEMQELSERLTDVSKVYFRPHLSSFASQY